MRAWALIAALLVGCASGAGAPATRAPSGPAPITAVPLWHHGEQMIWEVFWRGVSIGKAELSAGSDVRSKFATNVLARQLADVRYALSTAGTSADELVVLDGETTHSTLAIDGPRYRSATGRGEVPGGTPLHTLHSALGVLRAWAAPEVQSGYLWLVLRGKLYRLDAAPPEAEVLDGIRTLRLDCVVRALDPTLDQVDLTVWLADAPHRTPVRFVVDTSGERIAAQLVETTASFAMR